MKKFPDSLDVKNKNKFPTISYNRWKSYLRRELFEHIISHTEEEYFSLDRFNQRVDNMELVQRAIKELIPELEQLGWKCILSFGETGLFIYSEEKPANCWEEDII